MLGACLVKALYALPTWTRVADLIAEHPGLEAALGGAPSHWACYRFATKLRRERERLAGCIDALAESLRDHYPDMGTAVAIDASDMPAYGNGQRYLFNGGPERQVYSDPDASWGHRSAVRLYRGRSAVEREFGRLKHHYGLAILRVRGLERVRLHADLTIIGRLALELSKTR
jgi:transposase